VIVGQVNLFSVLSWWEQVTFQWDDDGVHFVPVLDQHTLFDFCSVSSLKQQSIDRHVFALLTHYPDCMPNR
jgi:hypothetical protein